MQWLAWQLNKLRYGLHTKMDSQLFASATVLGFPSSSMHQLTNYSKGLIFWFHVTWSRWWFQILNIIIIMYIYMYSVLFNVQSYLGTLSISTLFLLNNGWFSTTPSSDRFFLENRIHGVFFFRWRFISGSPSRESTLHVPWICGRREWCILVAEGPAGPLGWWML